jgi:hypothetical protein
MSHQTSDLAHPQGFATTRWALVLLAGGGIYGWRSRRQARAGDLKTIVPEVDPPQAGSARYFDGP